MNSWPMPNFALLIESGALTPKAQIMGTYMLCGFANFASIGIQQGGLSALASSAAAIFPGLRCELCSEAQ